jgi:hypothetical protein
MTRIAIDPTDLRRSATRIGDASSELSLEARSLGSLAMPEMPAGVAAEVEAGVATVSSQLQGLAPILHEDAVELERRALWTEIADRLAAGYPLEGSQLREFLAWMKDGSLMRYATEDEAELAGAYVGAMYRDRFKRPEDLFDLAQILHAAQQNAYGDELDAFSAAFVERFGAENLVEVPRVIQAIEWAHVLNSGLTMETDPHLLREVALEWADGELDKDPVNDLLAPFALALANATYSGRLSRTVEDEIAHDDDTWATAQLLHTGVFGTRFLLECFRTGVVDRIVEHSRYRMAGVDEPGYAPYALGAFWEHGDGEGLAWDTKQLVLDALARNPDAAREAFTTPLDGVEPFDLFGQQQEVTNPVRLLYDYGDFDDDGDSFGRAYLAAANDLHSDPRDTASVDTGNLLTLDVLDRVLHGDRVGMDGVGGLTDALARDLAQHHLEGLHYSAAAGDASDADGGRAGWTDSNVDHRIHLSEEELVDVLAAVTDREDAGQSFLDAAARYQAETILAGTESSPTFHSEFSWAHRAGAFTQLLMEAGDVNRTDDFQEADARAKMIVGFANDVVGLAKVPPLVDIAIDHGIDAIGSNLGPSADELVRDNNRAHAILENGVTAAIVQGYADNGHIDLSGAHERGLVEDGRLIRYNELNGIARARFHDWMNNDPEVDRVVREAVERASP